MRWTVMFDADDTVAQDVIPAILNLSDINGDHLSLTLLAFKAETVGVSGE